MMKIGILGSRGIPNNYGGFEQFAEHLAAGLARKGAEVWVYCSGHGEHRKKTWKGVNLIYCSDPEDRIGTAGQFIYDLLCILDSRKRNFDIIYQLGYTSSSVWHAFLPKNALVVTNMDGLEWKRSKYNFAVRKFLKYAEKLAVAGSDLLVADSSVIEKYLKQKYRANTKFIAYGADVFEKPNEQLLQQFNLKKFGYFLLIARMQPDNHIEEIIRGVLSSQSPNPLLVVGNTTNRFGRYLKKTFDNPQIVFQGSIYDEHVLNNLRHFSSLYFHGHSAGGTNPSLLEAMAAGALVCSHRNEFNNEVLRGNAYFFDDAAEISEIINNQKLNNTSHPFIQKNIETIRNHYNWTEIINNYHQLFPKLL
jgi:glycosyltransferase involved in cell wall biosynthesis